jgi:hypothetical protein
MQIDLLERDQREQAIEQLHQATAFYTAEPVVGQLLDMADWPRGGRRLVDASCGDGAFLGVALQRLLDAEPDADSERIAHLVTGWEIHYFAAAEARARLTRILVANGREFALAQATAAQMVVHGDFLTCGPVEPTWDCIAGNPPFLRYTNLPAILRADYERTLPDYSQGDMLHSFLARSTLALRAGGEICIVSSDRWLFTKCAGALRETVGLRLGIAHLARLDCESSFYRAKTRRTGQPPRIHPVAVVLRDACLCDTPLTRKPIYPEADDTAFEGCRTLADVAGVRLAPWLGPHGIFVVDRATARRANLPAQLLVPAIDTDDIKGGLLSAPTRFAIRTVRERDPGPEVMRHLRGQLHRMPPSKRRTAKIWLPPESFERMDLSKPSLLIPRITASLRPVRVPAGILPLDHGISIVSTGEVTLDELEAQFARPEAEAWVRARAPRLENGYYSLATSLLRTLPVRL